LIEQMSVAPSQPRNVPTAAASAPAEAAAGGTRAERGSGTRAELRLVGGGAEGHASAGDSLGAHNALARSARVAHLVVQGARRSLDILIAGGLLLALSPLLILVALAVRVDSGGPALFRQRRIGRGLSEFTMLKFRTMHSGADTTPHREYVQALIGDDRSPERGRLYKLSVDNRVTRVGRFLRNWSIDELPQLINVLLGQMALVGPRPVIPYEVEKYPKAYLSRFDVKPGLTGLWQVSGRNQRTYEEMVNFDLQYAREASLMLDLRILAKTVPVVLGRQGVA
jgi:lipopolysaccharide/colanic/teichoic acid biosynthesis glycosyltransferase